jgi:hypothetical protein
MQLIISIIYIIDTLLIIISIINLLRVNKNLDSKNNELEELIEAKEANQELRFENSEYEDTFNAIQKIINEKGQGSIVDRFDKIKEVIKSANQNNF